MGAYWDVLRQFGRDVRLNIITQASFGFCYFGIYAVLFNLYLLRLGYDIAFVSSVNAAGSLAFAVSSLSAGLTGERWGNRRMMFVGVSLAAAGFGLLPLPISSVERVQAGWIGLTYVMAWFGIAQFVVNATPYLMAVSGREARNHVFAMTAGVIPLAGLAGNLVGGILPEFGAKLLGVSLDSPLPYRYPLLAAAVLLWPGVFLVWFTRPVTVVRPDSNSAGRGRAPLALILLLGLVILLQRTGDGTARTFFNIYLDGDLHASTALIGSLSAAGQLLAVVASLITPQLIRRWGLERLIIASALGTGFSLLVMALLPNWGGAGLGYMGVTGLVSIIIPAFTVFNQEIVLPRWRTAVSGAATMAIGLSWSGMALAGGQVVTTLGYRGLFALGAGLTTAGALLFWFCFGTSGVQSRSANVNKMFATIASTINRR